MTMSTPLTVTVLAALWVSSGRCGVSEAPVPRCDNGKLFLDRDLPADAVYWDCPGSIWPKSTERLPSIDTVYDPVPARQICIDKSISYNHTIPNSGAYRPVRAESGEYLYCPPQRWLNNLHDGATVLLYHPCAPPHERLLLSALARSCLPDYIITSHPQLNVHMPIALVSWAHTLELSTVASSDVCDWLETQTSTRNKFGGVSQIMKYNLLLSWSAEQHQQKHARPEEHAAKMKESLRQCCEQAISSLLIETELESDMNEESLKLIKEEGKRRQIRAAIRGKLKTVKDESERENTIAHQTNRTGDGQNSTLGPLADSPPGNRTLSDPPGPREAPSQSKIPNTNHGLMSRPTAPLASTMSETTFRSVNSERNSTARPEALSRSSKDEGTDPAKQREKDSVRHGLKHKEKKSKDNTADGTMKDNDVVDVKERELEHEQTHSSTNSHHKIDKIAVDSVSKSRSESPPRPQQQQNPQPAGYLPNSLNCDSCKAGEHCECSKDLGASATAVNMGLPRTPRTDEAVWAAAALGFLLILLTLSVLHTRLYRHWRTTPSLYWHDPQQDYDSVADVIRRRLRIANRRRKRGRRQECVLLPSSSSSDEHP
ncbi:uncharacterized protein tp53i13 [Centropristis striata]|uniref:uncharacterized protein tp53i13 n=1 Tax=Centropristis striata TaxID=184440 RepID=UPI0027E130DC|nr:uncharacterized protein tp53i13 [Centropristis striata]